MSGTVFDLEPKSSRAMRVLGLGDQQKHYAKGRQTTDSKSGVAAMLPWVRIPPLPPQTEDLHGYAIGESRLEVQGFSRGIVALKFGFLK